MAAHKSELNKLHALAAKALSEGIDKELGGEFVSYAVDLPFTTPRSRVVAP